MRTNFVAVIRRFPRRKSFVGGTTTITIANTRDGAVHERTQTPFERTTEYVTLGRLGRIVDKTGVMEPGEREVGPAAALRRTGNVSLTRSGIDETRARTVIIYPATVARSLAAPPPFV